jgi:site-specific DNA-methyltransferase (adenine-specific)
MKPTIQIGDAIVYAGNNLEVLPTLPDNSVDSIVTDPPYELGFMGKSWDNSGIAYDIELWRECLRVLKPGGHLLAFSGSRTYHRMTVAIEDAGFEIRDMISWISNKTFPKSHNISKAIDKLQGGQVKVGKAFKVAGEYGNRDLRNPETQGLNRDEMRHTADTDDAKQWDGWGTALKPSVEPIVLARKPVEGTIAENVLQHGTGGINIDATRIGDDLITITNGKGFASSFGGGINNNGGNQHVGRWPSNAIIDETTAELLDEEKRFFYVVRASQQDRNEGLEGLEKQSLGAKGNGVTRTCATCNAVVIDGCECPDRTYINPTRLNFHPTVKPTKLMQYLIRLVTPENGIVLDPFCGSGSTGKAALLEKKQFIGIELTKEYLPIIEGRINHAYNAMQQKQDDLFE